MALQRDWRGPRGLVSPEIYSRLCRNGGEGELQRLTAAMSHEERRAFYAAVLLIDGAASVTQLADRWQHLPTSVQARPPAQPADDGGLVCQHCGKALAPDSHPLRRYCDRTCQVKAERLRNPDRVAAEKRAAGERRRKARARG